MKALNGYCLSGTQVIEYKYMGTALVQARIEPAIKEKAEHYFSLFGIDTAPAIRIFFAKVVSTGSIPFTIGIEAEDLYDMQIAEQAYAEYVAGGKKSRPISELYKKCDIL